jgi:hypothetical protein
VTSPLFAAAVEATEEAVLERLRCGAFTATTWLDVVGAARSAGEVTVYSGWPWVGMAGGRA